VRNPFRPSLARRVVIALMIGILLSWAAFVGVNFWRLQAQQEDDKQNFSASPFAVQLVDALQGVEDTALARAVAAAMDRISSKQRERGHFPIKVVMQVRDRRDQQLVYSTPAGAGEVLRGDPAVRTEQVLGGEIYQVFEVDTSRWAVVWARTLIDKPWVLRTLGAESIRSIAIAIPFLFLPVWLAVLQGLRPLRQFSDRIAARGPNDMSPIGLTPKQAEMQPLAAALDTLLTVLRQKIEAEQMFVANAAHELRTPLAVVTAQAHVLSKAATAEERSEAEARLEAAMSRASHLIHQLLVLARMEMDPSAVGTSVDLAQLVCEEVAHFVPAASARNIDISLEAPDALLIALEVQSLRSVLQNLIDNAVRYSGEGGKVIVKLVSHGGAAVLSVMDNGPGIAEGDRARIFDRFYRGERPPEAPGIGLGLTIVKVAAARMRGELSVGPGLDGGGCCFVMEIPISKG
jgi:signal transduction histidine kinase